jgi:hypothetical protein
LYGGGFRYGFHFPLGFVYDLKIVPKE